MNANYARLKSLVIYAVSVSLAMSGALPTMASAQSITCNYGASQGTQPQCAAVRISSGVVTYPKINWQRVSEAPAISSLEAGDASGDSVTSLANRSAEALGLNASELARMVTTFPSNVPYVLARYNPMDSTLRIDLFKLEKTYEGAQIKAGLYHAQFGPAHGDMWKAARGYISPADYKSGMTPGLNPFESFKQAGDDIFHGISLAAAQVATGHAMRATGTPFALLAVAEPRLSSVEHTDSGWFKKTTKVWVYGHAKPNWYIAQSTSTLARSTPETFASYCAIDPTQTTCPVYGTAVSGVAFEQFEGGTLSALENTWLLDYKEQSGFTFLAMLVIGVLASYAMVGLLSAVSGTAAAGSSVAAGATEVGAASMGSWGNLLVTTGGMTPATSIAGAIAVEASVVGGSMLLGGANLGSTFDTSPESVLLVARVSKGVQLEPTMSTYQAKLNVEVAPTTVGDIVAGNALSGVNKTVTGDCSLGSLAQECIGATAGAGVISRPDELREQNDVEFSQENDGRVFRAHPHK